MYAGEQHIQRANYELQMVFLTAWRVATPNPCEFDRLTVYVIESSLTVPQEFWLMEKNG